MENINKRHSVELIPDKCIGCTDCIKRCPTEAIRVRNSKATIDENLCIDCGVCIRVCRNHAKRAVTNSLDVIRDERFKYRVVIPAPSLYSQFLRNTSINAVLTALKRIGFDDVLEVSRAAEMITAETVKILTEEECPKPMISSACPAVIRLMAMRFPSLMDNIMPVSAPIDVAASAARQMAMRKGYEPDEIGVFFISPCSAKATAAMYPIGMDKSDVDGVISIADVYLPLRNIMAKLDPSEYEDLCQRSFEGMGWAATGGESADPRIENAIAVDGLENVIRVLEQVEDGQLDDVDFIEANACMSGCVGGPLTVINGYVARNILKKVRQNAASIPPCRERTVDIPRGSVSLRLKNRISPANHMRFGQDMGEAIKNMEDIEAIYAELPHIDCGSCGAPNCNAFAEDVVLDGIPVEDCIFMMRRKVKELAEEMADLAAKMPQTMTGEKAGN
ncbi:MAG: 4Fe-4S binding protein [Clostridiales bacterium]|jgi:iron only hydrogenase large subunit-like protein|nr:4Fe-4S binding protein [Clostridiales bacterium]